MKKVILRFINILFQFGFEPIKLYYSVLALPNYIFDYLKIKKKYNGMMDFYPCLSDKFSDAGSTKNEYFWQDLYLSKLIYKNKPKNHLDIGSRLDGFVSSVSVYRKIDVFDIRPLNTKIPNIYFKKIDLMDNTSIDLFLNSTKKKYDSISCLHALEHFGLGRYGDSINVNGYSIGIKNISRLLVEKGILYLTVPVGYERIIFNSHWVFNPKTILETAENNNLLIKEKYYLNKNKFIKLDNYIYKRNNNDSLGLFIFEKI